MIDPIKLKIEDLCPDVIIEHTIRCDMDTSHGYVVKHLDCVQNDITLAVMLRAIAKKTGEIGIEADGRFIYTATAKYVGCAWNLEHDNYDQQSEECKQFIGSLLGV